jgi:hypothetical protein
VSETPRALIAKAGAAVAVSKPDPGPSAPLAKAPLEGFDKDPSTTINSVRADVLPGNRPTIRPNLCLYRQDIGHDNSRLLSMIF